MPSSVVVLATMATTHRAAAGARGELGQRYEAAVVRRGAAEGVPPQGALGPAQASAALRALIAQAGDAAVEERRTAISPEEEPIRSSGSAANLHRMVATSYGRGDQCFRPPPRCCFCFGL